MSPRRWRLQLLQAVDSLTWLPVEKEVVQEAPLRIQDACI